MIKAYWVPEVEETQVTKTRKVFLASHYQWPGVLAQGDTIEEAVRLWHENRQDRENDLSIHDVPFPDSGRAVWSNIAMQCYRHNGMTHVLALLCNECVPPPGGFVVPDWNGDQDA